LHAVAGAEGGFAFAELDDRSAEIVFGDRFANRLGVLFFGGDGNVDVSDGFLAAAQ
jgi:hypothetical protein